MVTPPSPTDPVIIRAKVSGLCRFAKAQLTVLPENDSSIPQIQADIARYESYMSNPEAFLKEAKDDIQLQVDMITKLDRYPDVPISKVLDITEVLEKKMKSAFAILEQQPKQHLEVDPDYFPTSKFKILSIHTGSIVCLPYGDVPPGAVEILLGQVIETKVDGEEVYIEVENVQEGMMMLWFKPDVTIPTNAEIVWSYSYEPTATVKSGTKWLTQDNVVVVSNPEQQLVATEGTEIGEWAVEVIQPEAEEEPAKFYPPRKVVDIYKPLADKLATLNSPDTAEAFKQALLNYGDHFDLETEYASHYDREVVEAKRDRYINALVAAQTAPVPVINPITLALDYAVAKGELIDHLRVTETRVAGYQLQARLHERILAGEPVTLEEMLEYRPHDRDDAELEREYNDFVTGRYWWQLYPQMDGDPDCLIKDLRYKDLPPQVNSRAKMLAEYEKTVPLVKKAERAAFAKIYAALAVEKKDEDTKSGKLWPGVQSA